MSETITVRVIPNASKNAIEGWESDAAGQQYLKVRLTTVPEDGKANAALLKLLSKAWGCPASSLSIIRGHKQRMKQVSGCPATVTRPE